MNYMRYLKNKIIEKLKYTWGNIYFAFDKYNEFDANFEYEYLDCSEFDYFSNIIYNYLDDIFGKNLYRFSSRKLLNEENNYYGKFSFDRSMCKYHEYTELSNLYDGSLCIRLAYFMQNDKLFDIAQNFITKIYDSLAQFVIRNYGIEEVKSAKIYKFYDDDKTKMNNYNSYGEILKNYNVPRIIADAFDKNSDGQYYSRSVYKCYTIDKYYYSFDDTNNIIVQNISSLQEENKRYKYENFIKSMLNEYSNKIYIQDIFKNFICEIISKDDKKYLIVNNFPYGLHIISHGTSFMVPDFEQLMREYACNYIRELSSNNNFLSKNQHFFKVFNTINDIFSLNSVKEFNLIKGLTDVEEHVKAVTNNLDYNNCSNIEDFMAQFSYYLDKKYYNFDIKEIYSCQI